MSDYPAELPADTNHRTVPKHPQESQECKFVVCTCVEI